MTVFVRPHWDDSVWFYKTLRSATNWCVCQSADHLANVSVRLLVNIVTSSSSFDSLYILFCSWLGSKHQLTVTSSFEAEAVLYPQSGGCQEVCRPSVFVQKGQRHFGNQCQVAPDWLISLPAILLTQGGKKEKNARLSLEYFQSASGNACRKIILSQQAVFPLWKLEAVRSLRANFIIPLTYH